MEEEALELVDKIEQLRHMSRGYFNVIPNRDMQITQDLLAHSHKVKSTMEECLRLAKVLDSRDKDPRAEPMSAAIKRVSRDVAHSLASESSWRGGAKKRASAVIELFQQGETAPAPSSKKKKSSEGVSLREQLKEVVGKEVDVWTKTFKDGRLRELLLTLPWSDLGVVVMKLSFKRVRRREDCDSEFVGIDLEHVTLSSSPNAASGDCSLFRQLSVSALQHYQELHQKSDSIRDIVGGMSTWFTTCLKGTLKEKAKWVSTTELIPNC